MEESAVELNVDFEPGPLGLALACSGDHVYNTQISGIKPTGAVCTYNQGVEEKRQLKTGMVLVRLGDAQDREGSAELRRILARVVCIVCRETTIQSRQRTVTNSNHHPD
jgi:hypothetical protein